MTDLVLAMQKDLGQVVPRTHRALAYARALGKLVDDMETPIGDLVRDLRTQVYELKSHVDQLDKNVRQYIYDKEQSPTRKDF